MKRRCTNCGKELEHGRSVFCSTECKRVSYRKRNGGRTDCLKCGAVLTGYKRTFCSDTCKFTHQGLTLIDGRWRKNLSSNSCPGCGAPFLTYSRSQTYCSKDCKDGTEVRRRNAGQIAESSTNPDDQWRHYEQEGSTVKWRRTACWRPAGKPYYIHEYTIFYTFSNGRTRKDVMESDRRQLKADELDQYFQLVIANNTGLTIKEVVARMFNGQ